MLELTDFIPVVANATNVILSAILLQVGDFSARLNLPTTNWLSTNAVKLVKVSEGIAPPEGMLVLTNGMQFWFRRGVTYGFRSPKSYFSQQDPSVIPQYYGELKMGPDAAIELVQNAIIKLGYDPELLLMDMRPTVEGPEQVDGQTIPHYEFTWRDPRNGGTGLIAEVDGEKCCLESLFLTKAFLWECATGYVAKQTVNASAPREPSIDAIPDSVQLNNLMESVRKFCECVNIKLPGQIGIERATVRKYGENDSSQSSEIELKNGFLFRVINGQVRSFSALDAFFKPRKKMKIREYFGERKMDQMQLVNTARSYIERLGYVESDVIAPGREFVLSPYAPEPIPIPRFVVNWNQHENQGFKLILEVEIDASNGDLKTFYFSDRQDGTARGGGSRAARIAPKSDIDEQK